MLQKAKTKTRVIKADLLLLLVVTVWGTTFPVMKMILVDTDPFYFIALRFMVAFLALYLVFHKKVTRDDFSGETVRKGVILGLCLLAGYAFQIVGLQYTTASRSAFITGLSVVMVPLLSIMIIKQIPGPYTWTGVALATIGLYLLTGAGKIAVNLGDYLTFFCAVSFALQIVLLSKYLPGNKPVVLTLIQMAVVGGGSFLVSLFSNGITGVTGPALGVIIYTGLLATAMAYLIQSYAQQFTPPTHTGVIFTLEPVFGALFSYLILGEVMGFTGLFGGLLIVTGMLITEVKAEGV
ncbi:DMT family transporter [Halothermothrix orenii]|uniref:Permease of the drug/metabolite transporter (DMT) superfamily n=1 Tax=Halothermothrix orenii (strain H 168 / OCM 544 / DSM 9562) TaxID=373903 RepID=B8D2C5_HALOH|nr:DMT family transporter [Halothermothrix orenii]ACL69352.1 permease of the drug/metabolite transporter (DMT) superfamily [Halothermothrix orenii H 168]